MAQIRQRYVHGTINVACRKFVLFPYVDEQGIAPVSFQKRMQLINGNGVSVFAIASA